MPVLDQLELARVPLPQAQEVKRMLAAAFWTWYDAHGDDVIFTKKIYFVSVSLRVRQLESVFVRIFGER